MIPTLSFKIMAKQGLKLFIESKSYETEQIWKIKNLK